MSHRLRASDLSTTTETDKHFAPTTHTRTHTHTHTSDINLPPLSLTICLGAGPLSNMPCSINQSFLFKEYLFRQNPPAFTMKLGQHLFVCVLLLLCVTQSANGGNILVWYTEGSHWINMKPVLETLIDRGHQVTVLVPSKSMFMNTSESSRFGHEPFNISVSMETIKEFYEDYIHFSMYEIDHMSYLKMYIKYMDITKEYLQKFEVFGWRGEIRNHHEEAEGGKI
ncbi:hypothetical protein ABVT39_020603 [Epinephelus coioides]